MPDCVTVTVREVVLLVTVIVAERLLEVELAAAVKMSLVWLLELWVSQLADEVALKLEAEVIDKTTRPPSTPTLVEDAVTVNVDSAS